MSILKGIRAKVGEKNLQKEIPQNRKGKVMNFTDATSIAFVYEIKDKEQYQLIKEYIRHLKEEEGMSKVLALGYLDSKDVPDFVQHRLEFDFFTKKDVNWHQKPAGTEVENFINEKWDILIDLTTKKVVPLRFIMAQSKAKFKVGLYKPGDEAIYDLMIRMDKVQELQSYLEQVNHYLSIINRKNGD